MATNVIVAGALASKPNNGGEAWVRLSWVRALTALGFDVRFIEELPGASAQARSWFNDVIAWAGLSDRAVLLDGEDARSHATAHEWAHEAALLVNISGNVRDRHVLQAVKQRVYVDLDPGYTQLWHEQGLLSTALQEHHHHVTVGLGVGRAACDLPTGGFDWIGVVPPACVDDWSGPPGEPGRFTTIAAWRGSYGRVSRNGHSYGQKAHEFRRVIDLPQRLTWDVEVALAIDPADAADHDALVTRGWQLVDPFIAAGTPPRFRSYVLDSSAELSPAQSVYVETTSGWISDRTVRYLAAGRPALVQDTGLAAFLPTGEGLLTFSGGEDAVKRARELADDYVMHCRAARAWALEFASPSAALTPLLERTGVAP